MVFRSRSVREGGWGREGLFAGRSHSGRARAAPGKACTSDGTRRRARAPTSPDFKPLVPCARACMCTCIRVHGSPRGSGACTQQDGQGRWGCRDVVSPHVARPGFSMAHGQPARRAWRACPKRRCHPAPRSPARCMQADPLVLPQAYT